MNHIEAGRYWDENAPVWTQLARAGYDLYRDLVNTPAFLEMLPDVNGLRGLDIGCGEGYTTRLITGRGARLRAVDISPNFIAFAREVEAKDPLGIEYRVASAVQLPFADQAFDFVVATMSLMDIPEADGAVREAYRVLRPGGFLQFSIGHPCYDTPHRRLIRDADGMERALEVGGYFENADGRVNEWIFGAAPKEVKKDLRPFRTPYFHRTLSWWLNTVIEAGFTIERVNEPYADEETARKHPYVRDTRLVAYFLHVRCRR